MDAHDTIIRQLSEDMSYLRGRFDTAIPLMQKSADDINKLLASQDRRIGDVEKDLSYSKGKTVGIAAIFSAVISSSIAWFFNHH